jgi:ligand-binding SRPBCC domain-containing protein
MKHHFQAEQWIPYPRDRVFAFFANPENLPPLMPRWQHARIEKMQLTADYAAKGSLLVISFRPLPLIPLRMNWEAYIAEFEWNDYFCDEQRKGPFKYFRHCHRVTEAESAGVKGSKVSDDVVYELPLGILGDVANALAIKRQVAALFAYRQKMLPKLLARP